MVTRSTVLVLLCTALCVATAHAIPRYSLISGTRCSACHVSNQGGGARSELGWGALRNTGAIKPSAIGLGFLYDEPANSVLDGVVMFGMDVRYQGVMVGRPPNLTRKMFFMQVTPYLTITPIQEIVLSGSYNFARDAFPGQTLYSASVQIQPNFLWPTLTAGYIQPTVGIRHDDHTVFTRRDAVYNKPIIPPFYNEWGAEISYEGIPWLSLNAGVFSAQNLARADVTVDRTKPTFTGRIMFWPQVLDDGGSSAPKPDRSPAQAPVSAPAGNPSGPGDTPSRPPSGPADTLKAQADTTKAPSDDDLFGDMTPPPLPSPGDTTQPVAAAADTTVAADTLVTATPLPPDAVDTPPTSPPVAARTILRINGEAGTSAMINDKFRAFNLFAGVGLADVGTIYGEAFLATNASNRDIRNVSMTATCQVRSWLVFSARYEMGRTEVPGQGVLNAKAAVLTAEFFPIPFLELRPEIRYFSGDGFGSLTQFTFQAHAFY